MSHDVITQLRAYAQQLDTDGQPLADLMPGKLQQQPALPPRRRLIVALAAAALVVVAILIAVVTGLTGPEDDIIEQPTTVPISPTVPATTTPPPTETTPVPSTSLPGTSSAFPPLLMGYNTMGSAPFVFSDDGGFGAYFSSEWLYDSANRVARCVDASCAELGHEQFPLDAGSWMALRGDGAPIRLRVEVNGEVVPRQTFGQLLPAGEEGQPAVFAPASIQLVGCMDQDCSRVFRSVILEITDPEQISTTNPEAVPYPGGGKVFLNPDGLPVIIYSGIMTGDELIAATAVVICGDASCSGDNTIRVLHRTPSSALIVTETIAFAPEGNLVAAFVTITGEPDPATGVVPYWADGERRLYLAICEDGVCSSVETIEVEYTSGLPLLAMGSDGLPLLVHGEGTEEWRRVVLLRCEDSRCATSTKITLLELAPNFAYNLMSPSLTIAPDGTPLVTAVEWTGDQGRIHIAKCDDPACSTVQVNVHVVSDVSPATLEHVWSSSATFDPGGLPVIAYYQGTTGPGPGGEPEKDDGSLVFQVGFLRCDDVACSAVVP